MARQQRSHSIEFKRQVAQEFIAGESLYALSKRRVVPKPAVSRCSKNGPLFDNLVGAGEQRRWDFEAEGLRGLEVDDQFEFRRLHDREVGGLLALENTAGIDTGLAMRVCKAYSVAHQLYSKGPQSPICPLSSLSSSN